MESLSKMKDNKEVEMVVQELGENPFQKFNVAFALMSIIPFLVSLYLIATRISTISIIVGDVGLIMIISLLIALCGLLVGYQIIRKVILKVIFHAKKEKDSSNLKSKFLATASHELKSPFFVLSGNLELLMDDLKEKIDEESKERLALCRKTVGRTLNLVNNLLDIYKVEAGMVRLEKKLCDVAELSRTQAKELSILNEKKDIGFKEEFFPKELLVWGDEGKISEVINNLISNAIKYTPEKGQVSIKVSPAGHFVKIEVQDNGEGIPEDKIGKVFDKFERFSKSAEGSGLGLAIAKDIIELHGGKIWVESKLGVGTKFVAVFPLHRQ